MIESLTSDGAEDGDIDVSGNGISVMFVHVADDVIKKHTSSRQCVHFAASRIALNDVIVRVT